MIDQLYRSLFVELVSWCRSMTDDGGEAEEIVQEAFLRAMAHEAELLALEQPQRRAWLYRTVKRIFLDRCRRAKWLRSLDEMEENGSASERALMPTDESDWQMLIGSLPGIEGILFTLRYLHGYTSAQLGALYQMPPATVRSKLASARKHLKNMLGGEYDV